MKIFCIGRNYAKHAEELGNSVPTKPLVFMKPPTAALRDNKPFYYPEFSEDLHYEVEVVLKICKNGKHIQPAFADAYFQEIGLGIDFTARDVQARCKEKGHPWEIAKGFDHSAVVGKFLPKEDLVMNDIGFHLKKNSETVQEGNTRDLIFDFNTLICYISKIFTLQKGDYIYTGTPAGVGPVVRGDVLTGFIGTEQMFDCEVK